MTMATRIEHGEGSASDAVRGTYGMEDPARALALSAGLVLTATYVSELYGVTSVVGGTDQLFTVVAASLVLATLLARLLRPLHAATLGVTLLGLGILSYVHALPYGWFLVYNNADQLVSDVGTLLTGVSVLQMAEAGTWAVGVAPAPVFLSWYLLVRQRYAAGTAVGGIALGMFVLTGDAGPVVTVVGVASGAATVGLGEIERRNGTIRQVDTLAVVVTIMVVIGMSVASIPVGGTGPLGTDHGTAGTIEGDLMANTDEVAVTGSVELSPEVRFVVESEEPAYWRVDAYDRYTGQGWVRSGQANDATRLPRPPGDHQRVEQRFTAQSDVAVMPAAWRPIDVSGEAGDRAGVTALGGLVPEQPLQEGDRYQVTSARPVPSGEDLGTAGTDYPTAVEREYTQLPEQTPDRVGEFTDDLTADAETPYEETVLIEQWLRTNKEYSLDVERPEETVADSFLFEMDAGYCTYFATTMVTMLRTQDVPARFVTGYSEGQRVAEDRWVVRGLNSHAWVEVYFPDVGWVAFDPTPSDPRSDARTDRIEDARESGEENVDAAGSEDGTWTPTPGPGDGTPGPGTNDTPGDPGSDPELNETPAALTPEPADEDDGSLLPPHEFVGLAAVILVGAVAAARRTGAVRRLGRIVRIRWQGSRGTPRQDVERSFERLEYLLERDHRERRIGESRRSYLQSLRVTSDERVRRVSDLYHRARYGGGVSREEAEETIALVDELVRDRLSVFGRD